MDRVNEESVLPRRVVPQPTPPVSPGGDCAACVLGGLLDMTVREVYTDLYGEETAPSRPETLTALHRARTHGLVTRLITATPIWHTPDYYMAFGPSGYLHHLEWFDYTRMAIEAGYYGVAHVVFKKTGNRGQCPPPTDHLVLLCGAREVTIPIREGVAKIEQQVLVSCSAKSSPDEEWVEVREFLIQRGGYNAIWVKPSTLP